MKIYLRHICNGFRRRPWQPVVVILCIALAVAVFLAAFVTKDLFSDYQDYIVFASAGSSDVRMDVTDHSDVRYMETKHVTSLLGDEAEVVGYYGISALYLKEGGASFASIKLADLESLNACFAFEYVEQGDLNIANLHESALISEHFASKHGLQVGDDIELGVQSYSFTYTVQGILKSKGLMSENVTDVLVTHAQAVRALRTWSGVFIIDDEMQPCSTILIKLKDASRATEYMELLAEQERYNDKSISLSFDKNETQKVNLIMSFVMYFIICAYGCIAIVLIDACLKMLGKRRKQESDLFRAIGAPRSFMVRMQYMEMGMYALVGILIGLPLGYLLTHLYSAALGIEGFDIQISLPAVFISIAFGLAVSMLSVTLHMRSRDDAEKDDPKIASRMCRHLLLLCLSALALISVVLILTLPMTYRYIPAIILFLTLAGLCMVLVPYALAGAGALFDRMLRRSGSMLSLAVKNAKVKSGIANYCRMLCVVLSLLLFVVYGIEYTVKKGEYAREMIDDGYIVSGVSESQQALARTITKADQSGHVYFNQKCVLPNGLVLSFYSIAPDAPEGLLNLKGTEGIKPTGDQLYLTYEEAASIEAEPGDKVDVVVDGKTYSFVLSGVLESNLSFGLFDCTHIGAHHNTAYFRAADDTSKTALYEELCSVYAPELIPVIEVDAFLDAFTWTSDRFVSLLRFMFYVTAAVCLFGCLNSYMDHYHDRTAEFDILKKAGMSRGKLRIMLFWEALFGCLLCCVMAVGFYAAYVAVARAGLASFGLSFRI